MIFRIIDIKVFLIYIYTDTMQKLILAQALPSPDRPPPVSHPPNAQEGIPAWWYSPPAVGMGGRY